MAHFVLDYSANLDPDTLNVQSLFEKLHQCADESGVFPLKGLRSRAHACNNYRLADGNPEHAFVHLQVLMGAGRDFSVREQLALVFFEVLQKHLAPVFSERGLALSFELKELEAQLKYNKNNIQDHLKTQDAS